MASLQSLCRAQLGRLLQMIVHLQSGSHPNATGLAGMFEVSRRTVYRDLETLILAGVPVQYRPDLQGYEILAGFFLEPPRLDEEELAALILQAARPGVGGGPDRRAEAYGALLKIAESCAEGVRDRMLALIEATRDPGEPIPLPEDRRQVHDAVINAVARGSSLRVWFQMPDSPDPICTKIAPRRLVLDGDEWVVVGRSSFHRDVVRLPIARIDRVVEMEGPTIVGLASRAALKSVAEAVEVHLRFPPAVAPEIRDGRWLRAQRIVPRDGGELDLFGLSENPIRLAGWVLGFGDRVRVIAPDFLRDEVRETARRVARFYFEAPRVEESGRSPGSVGG